MSIIAALDCGASLLLAADSVVTETGGVRLTSQKLHVLADRPVAWGCAGDEGIGLAWSTWFKLWTWPVDATWESVTDGAIEHLSQLNGRRRHLVQASGVTPTGDDLTTVLLAGYVGGVPDIVELTDRGAGVSVRHNVFAAIGSGQPHALIAYHALKGAGLKAQDDRAMLGYITQLAARMAPMCGMPIRILRIAPDGVADVTSDGD